LRYKVIGAYKNLKQDTESSQPYNQNIQSEDYGMVKERNIGWPMV
jgi:hypothetical protein